MVRFLICFLAFSYAFGQDLDSLIIPRKTDIFVTLQRTVHTKTAQSGDKFYGQIAVPVTSQDRIVIPVGSHVIGHVEMSREAGRLKGKAQLQLAFETIILPDGMTRQIEAVVQSAEGYRSDHSEETGKLESAGSQGDETAAGAAGGAIAGGVIGVVSGRDFKGLGTGAAVGSGAGALIGLFQKGEDVVLPKGTSLTIQLENDIRFIKPTSRNRGIRLQP